MTSEPATERMLSFGKYRAIAELGVGGMAEVYLAIAHGVAGFSKLHVIKRLKSELAAEKEFLLMFMDEARLAARLNHPNIAQTYEVSVEDDNHFLVMEYVEGQPLSAILRRAQELGESVPLMVHLQIIHDMLAGLHHAHEAKDFDGRPLCIVHRDVSPHNVLVSVDGHVKLVDFGVAKAITGSVQTLSGTIKGKVRYLSPEQVYGEQVDRRADVFAVGVMLWEALAEEKFWGDLPEYAIIARLMAGDLPRLRASSQERAHKDLVRIVKRALAIKPDERYPTAAALRADLGDYLHHEGRRPDEQAVGQLVARLFEKRLARIRSALENLQHELQEASHSVNVPLLDLREPQTSSSKRNEDAETTALDAPRPRGDVSASAALAAAADVARNHGPDATPGGATRPFRKLILAGVSLLVIAAAGFGALRGSNGDHATVPAGASETSPPVPATIALHIEATPANATLLLDDQTLQGNPFHGTYPKDDAAHVIRVRADGFDEQRMTVDFRNDVTVRISLVMTAPSAAAPSAVSGPSNPRGPTRPTGKRHPSNRFDPGDPWQ